MGIFGKKNPPTPTGNSEELQKKRKSLERELEEIRKQEQEELDRKKQEEAEMEKNTQRIRILIRKKSLRLWKS